MQLVMMSIWMLVVASIIIGFIVYFSNRILKSMNIVNQYAINLVKIGKRGKISFKSTYKNNTPIIQLEVEGAPLNFILDTGANINAIDEAILKKINPKIKKGKSFKDIVTGGGNKSSKEVTLNVNVQSDKHSYKREVTFDVYELAESLSQIEKWVKVPLHGVIGAKFFVENCWKIDFDELVVWCENGK